MKYRICDKTNSSICDEAEITIVVSNFELIDAQNDINQTPIYTPAVGNLLTNDSSSNGVIKLQEVKYLDSAGNEQSLPLDRTAAEIYDQNKVLAGNIVINSNGEYVFIPAEGFKGSVPLTYTINNGSGKTDDATLTIEVIDQTSIGGNDKPIAQDDTSRTEINTTVKGAVLNNDSDPDGDILVVASANVDGSNFAIGTSKQVSGVDSFGRVVSNAGSITINQNGTYTFVPATGFTGTVNPIGYTVSDQKGGTDDAIIYISVNPETGNVTYANDDANSAPKGNAMKGNVLTNDTDPEGDTQTVTKAVINGIQVTIGTETDIPYVGKIKLDSNGNYTFTPNEDYAGTLNVQYTKCDSGNPQACDTATLYLTSLYIQEVCYKEGNFNGSGLPTNVGISALRNGSTDNWPMVREGAWLALESKTKGFVLNRLTSVQIEAIPVADLVIGMMVYNKTLDCMQINIDGTKEGWKCFGTPACPD